MYDSPNSDPVRVDFDINQPRFAERYYSRNSKIYERNRMRQDDFQLERNIQTKDWVIIVNTSNLGMNNFDTYYIGRSCNWWYDSKTEELY